MNITVDIDDELLARVQEVAERRGMTVDAMIRDYLRKTARRMTSEEVISELQRLWAESKAGSGGRRWTREELYDRPIFR